MRIVVSSQGDNLEAPTSPVFGRCVSFVFVDPETMACEAMSNPAISQGGGAGIQAAQFVLNQGAEVVLTGNLGPNAFDVFQAADIPSYLINAGTVRQAVEAYKAGKLQPMGGANVAAHAGMSGGGRRSDRDATAPEQSETARQAKLAELRETLNGLRQQLAETMTHIEQLEKEE